jgi:hypothetical protein
LIKAQEPINFCLKMFKKIIIIKEDIFVLMHLKKIISSLGSTLVDTYFSSENFLLESN